MGPWVGNSPSVPHWLLNAYVRVLTEFTPIDCHDVLVATEPEVQSPKLQGFLWDKLKQGVTFLNFPRIAGSCFN